MSINYKLLLGVFIGLACVMLAPNLVYGVREAHDIRYHLSLFLSYRDAVELGTLYPRWLPDQLQGLGSPALMIYPPLSAALFVLIDFLTFHALTPERVLGLGALMLSIASAITFYVWARNYACARLGLIAALFYATAPYHLNLDLYNRGAMAEYTTFVWIPLIFLGIRTTILNGGVKGPALLAISTSVLLLTHLLTAMLIAPMALAYALICLRMELPAGLRIRRFVLVGITAVLGAGLVAFYYVPALLFMPEINSAGLDRDVATYNIFTALGSLTDRFKLKLLAIACAYLVFFLYLLAETVSNWRKQRALTATTALALMWVIFGILSFALMSGMFPYVFRPPSPYAQTQFGWRLLMVMEFALVSLYVCTAAGLQQAASRSRLLKVGAIVLLMLATWQAIDITKRFRNDAFSADLLQDEGHVKRRLSAIEYFPIGTNVKQKVENAIKPFEQYAISTQPAFIDSNKGKLVEATRKGAQFTVHSIANEPTPIMIQQFYFPGWKALDEQGTEIAVFRDEASSLASYVVPAGEHTIVVKRVLTKQEHWGNMISLVALFLLILNFGYLIRRCQTGK
ncbi:MAG: hypothetical protein V4695_07340 [Pseudomonadota bacterium]